MEKFPNFEQREREIDMLIANLAEREGMDENDILSDLMTFARLEDSEEANPDYFDEVAEMIGISPDEMKQYAIKKASKEI